MINVQKKPTYYKNEPEQHATQKSSNVANDNEWITYVYTGNHVPEWCCGSIHLSGYI